MTHFIHRRPTRARALQPFVSSCQPRQLLENTGVVRPERVGPAGLLRGEFVSSACSTNAP